MAFGSRSSKPVLVSFSGLDGSGKSTQIANLVAVLRASGYRVRRLAFWDDVVVGTRFREGFVHKAYKSERGIGAPGRPVARRDKNVRRWYLTLARHLLYLLDALNLMRIAPRALRGCDVLILDRYIYDELANLPLHDPLTRMYVRLVDTLVPRPAVAFLLDADPEAARERKPEYPVEFMRSCRAAYKQLALMLRTMTVVPPLPLADALVAVERAFWLNSGLERIPAASFSDDDLSAAPAA